MYNAVELFSGGGGLAVGLKRAGVHPVAAVELDQYAAATFAVNHPTVKLFRLDVREITGSDLIEASPTRTVDILAACPPCQGFSTLTTKYRRSDDRNLLVAEVGRIAAETLPLGIMMENVPGLASRGSLILEGLIADLTKLGYVTRFGILQVADYGVPQMRRRLVLLAGLGFTIDLPRPTHSQKRTQGLPAWRTLRDTIDAEATAYRIDQATDMGGFDAVNWNVTRKLGKANLERLRQAEPGKSREQLTALARPNCHRNKDVGFNNTYGRMMWDRPSPTITAGCLSPSKGRFGHPDELRTISLREASLLQTFPKDYKFVGEKIDRACSIVGNALPCIFAEQIAAQVSRTIRAVEGWLPSDVIARRARLSR